MPRRFLKADNREALSNFPSTIDEGDLLTHFLLTPDDLEQVRLNRTDMQRIGFAVLLCGLRYLGFFPNEMDSVPDNVVDYLAEQLGCASEDFSDYGNRAPTRREHQRVIMRYLGLRWCQDEETQLLFQWLSQRALENDRLSILLQQASKWLYKQRIIRPGITTLEELVLNSRERAHRLTYERIAQSLNTDLEKKLDHLLAPNSEIGSTPLIWLRRPAQGYRATDILQDLQKLDFVYQWAIDEWQLPRLPLPVFGIWYKLRAGRVIRHWI
jgi:TnpA family transposase